LLATLRDLPLKALQGSGFGEPSRHMCALHAVGYEQRAWPRDSSYHLYNRKRRYNMCAMQITLEGEGAFRDVETDQARTIAPGEGVLMWLPSKTELWLPSEGRWLMLWIMAKGDAMRWIYDSVAGRTGNIFHLGLGSRPVRLLAELYRDVYRGAMPDGSPSDAHAQSAAVYSLFMAMLSQTAQSAEEVAPEAVGRARALLEGHYADPSVDVAFLARETGLSRFHLTRLFRRHVGVPPYAYLTNLRLTRAAELITQSHLPLKEVAAMCGFANYRSFSNVFLRRHGMRPSRMRHEAHR
jgi:AraC-like DNA-binding protein